jgi:hypothetical protein
MNAPKSVLRVGFWAALLYTLVSVVYLILVTLFVFLSDPSSLTGADSTRAASISAITLVGVILLVVLWATIYLSVPAEKKVFALVSLIFVVLLVAMTSINRWVHLTVVRQAFFADVTNGLEWFLPYGDHSIMFALEILGWDWFLGFALLFLAPVFRAGISGVEHTLFWLLIASGALCLVGGTALLLGSPALAGIGGVGFGLGLTLVSALLAVVFRRGAES